MRLSLLFFLSLVGVEAWRNQYPASWQEDLGANDQWFQYITFWYRVTDILKTTDFDAYPSCRDVVGYPPTATFHYHQPGSGSLEPHIQRTYTLQPKGEKQPSLGSMSSCCASICGGKMIYRLVTYIEFGFTKPGREEVIYGEVCTLCSRTDTGVRNCSDGQYATNYLKIDSEGIQVNPVQCLPCPPGTWMTCAEKSNCTWPIPLTASDYNPGKDFWMPKNSDGKYYTPIGTCLPCESAGSSKSHYGDYPGKASFIQATPSYEFTTTSPEARTVGLPWYCPGGNLAPRMCTIPDTHGDPLTSERCVCKAGFALTVSNTCATCPRGNRCKRGFAEACPDHSHQPNTGQIDCINCTSDGTERGVPTAYCGQSSQLRKCISVYKASPLLCVNCNQCRKMYLPNNAGGKVDCYN